MSDPGSPSGRQPAPLKLLLLIGLFAAALRLGVGLEFNLRPGGDGIRGYQFYGEMARNLVEGRGLRWAFYLGMGTKWANRPPVYPGLIAAVLATGLFPVGLIVIQSLLGGLNAVLCGLLGAEFGGRRAAVLASIAVLGYPYSLLADTSLIEHVLLTTAILLIALAHLWATRSGTLSSAGLLGAALGVAVLTRVTVLACAPFLFVSLVLGLRSRRGFGRAAVMLLGLLLVLAPWLYRNARVVGAPVVASDTGRALWVAHNPYTLKLYPKESIDHVEVAAFRALPEDVRARIRASRDDELGQSKLFRELALDYIGKHPGRVLEGMLVKAFAFFSPLLNPPTEPPAFKAVAYTLSYVPVLFLGVAGLIALRRRWREWIFIPALFLGFLASAVLTWGQSRYRIPLDPLLMAAGASLLAAWLRRRGTSARENPPE